MSSCFPSHQLFSLPEHCPPPHPPRFPTSQLPLNLHCQAKIAPVLWNIPSCCPQPPDAHCDPTAAICSNLCYGFYFESGMILDTWQVFKVFWKRGFKEAWNHEYFLWLSLELRAFILHMGLAWENPTCQSHVYFFFICKGIRRIMAAAQTYPCDLLLLKHNMLK